MPKLSQSRKALLLLMGVLALESTACKQISTNQSQVSSGLVVTAPAPQPASKPPATPNIKATPLTDPYQLALDQAAGALNISQSAQSQDDWLLVADRWQAAIALLKTVPATSPNRTLAKRRLQEYQLNWLAAKKRLVRPEATVAALPTFQSTDSGMPFGTTSASTPTAAAAQPAVYQARIVRRAGGTPVIAVTFNGKQQFEMIVDTGASKTLLTQQMAHALNVVPVASASVMTASDRSVEIPFGLVKSIEVNGALVNNVMVGIGSNSLDLGLLGHDFFGDYDVTIKQDVVEFRPRA